MQKRVALLGGTGFVGTNLGRELNRASIPVADFSRTTGCDLLDVPKAWREIREWEPSHVINCAAHVGSVKYVGDFPADVVDDNMRMVLNVYKIVAKLPNSPVLINPIASCGYPGELVRYEEHQLWNGPVHPSVVAFGSTRRMIDVLARCYFEQHDVRSMNVMVPNLYGPHDSTNPARTHAMNALIIKFVRALKGGSDIEVWGTGKPIREWLYVKDLCRFFVELVEGSDKLLKSEPFKSSSPINIGQNAGASINDIAAAIRDATGFQGNVTHNYNYPDGAPKKVMSDEWFRALFPDFQFTPLLDGVADTVEHFRQRL